MVQHCLSFSTSLLSICRELPLGKFNIGKHFINKKHKLESESDVLEGIARNIRLSDVYYRIADCNINWEYHWVTALCQKSMWENGSEFPEGRVLERKWDYDIGNVWLGYSDYHFTFAFAELYLLLKKLTQYSLLSSLSSLFSPQNH